ncbi:magnesium-translocating P-type ATPase [Polynucleobacter sp. AP-Nino-20-G2]|uniref:magnesium-translocating P-type ATPase n=1 Tax=Polynucleobacter sp. AP-Nino-20-G2 TaxID=2576917 RepID=UPI001BFEEBA2|nr:magnesium-translocating P-type ATPase [Polynucleobacter sp. AP-Nino-20-G2]QWE15883.1 magnesium-translocating P-type ATPase [Polynucleobacter sp. AP-Nino-20-G2]
MKIVQQESADIFRLAHVKVDLLLADLGSSTQGLKHEIALDRLSQYGPNAIDITRQMHPALQFLALFLSPLSLLLIALSTISFVTGGTTGAIVIAIMVILSTSLAFVQEYKSNRAAEKLRQLVSVKVTVVREGIAQDIPLSQVVPGDLVRLSAGDLIPADLRLLSSNDLFVNQSSLTGEAMPVEKTHLDGENAKSVFELDTICFMGSHVVSGLGEGVVLNTAAQTMFGKLAKEISVQKKVSGFDIGIKKFIWLMIKFMAVMVPAVFLINGLIKGDWMEALLFATAVAVGLTPEMLPMLVTINLAKGAIAMSRKRVIVKRLNSIQNLGAMDVLCTDKTGTLTQDEIILERYVDIQGNEDESVLEYAYLNSHYQSGLKNLLDVAVLKHVDIHHKLHESDTYQKVDEIPFDFQRRRMSVIVKQNESGHLLICKGAVEELAAKCSQVIVNGKPHPLTEELKAQQEILYSELSSDGFRVIAVAIKDIPIEQVSPQNHYTVADEERLILVGYVAFLDPPKDSAKPAIEGLHLLGVKVKILTGDNELVTRKICSEVGVPVDLVMVGSELDAMSDQELGDRVEATSVFARMSPQQKARVISILQSRSHVVGYLGDGINDGPGLKVADVSISVDTAVDIAKESADIILLEKSLLILKDGVLEGRKVFGNIMKYIKMSASSNFGNMFSMLGASAILPFLPMAPVQILLNNLLYDFSQTSVPSDHVDEEYLLEPRAWNIAHIARYMFCIGPISSVFDYATFALLWYIVGANSIAQAGLFQTGWFVESLLSQTLIVHIIRTGRIPFIQSRPSWPLLITTSVICGVAAVLPYTVLSGPLGMEALPAIYWYGLLPILLVYLVLTQLVKSMLVKRFGLI